jgi:hypothetical protein
MKTLSLKQKILAGVAIAIAVAVFGWCQRREGQQLGAINQEIKASAVVVGLRGPTPASRSRSLSRRRRSITQLARRLS